MHTARLVQLRDERAKSYVADPDLLQPLKAAEERVRQNREFESELQRIKDHVQTYRVHYNNVKFNKGEFSAQARYGTRGSWVKLTIGEQQGSIRAVSEAYARNMPTGLVLFDDAAVRRVAASCAYREDCLRNRYNFCFAVAWSELCALKAQAKGRPFYPTGSGIQELDNDE